MSRTALCSSCAEKVVYIEEPRCKQCGKPVRYVEQEYCQDCAKHSFSYEQGRSIWLHKEPVNRSIYWFKYKNRRIYAEFYAKEWRRLYGNLIQEWGIDVIVPVPLHWRRKYRRGYNQAEELAKQLGKLVHLPVDTKAVVRRKYTTPQKVLNDRERRKNLEHVFRLRRGWKTPQRILLVDDIYTTGSTIDSVARVLSDGGRNKVWFLTISIGQGF